MSKMDSWEHFLNTIGTKGGNILVLILFVIGLMGALVHVLHHGQDVNAEAKTVIISTFSAFSGALLGALTSSGGARRPTDNGGKVEPPKPTP